MAYALGDRLFAHAKVSLYKLVVLHLYHGAYLSHYISSMVSESQLHHKTVNLLFTMTNQEDGDFVGELNF